MEFYRFIGEKNNMRIDIITSDGTKDNVDLSFQNFTWSPTTNGSSIAQSGRLLSLDIFRGLTVVLMIFVEYAGGIYPSVNHSPWNGITLADFVMPFFLFIVGVSLALAYKNLPCRLIATRKAIYRGIKLFIIGLFLQGGYFHGFGD
ncbi:hypothetical protein RDI58_003469 [Solanum bulbocastanum]|uniref:Heparan-alpha-glucosaminide N-acetyltransferase catalytic domain-containing protein n=1 Tax=Solanum bulbocastanum TaxID=147425 RepID=A0AAN8U8G8_SOLBU